MGANVFDKIKKLFISLVVAVIAFYPLFTPVVYAVDSWSGNPWTGDSWEGNPWDGSHLQWQGESWEGEGTQGNPWDGEGTQGESWEGSPIQEYYQWQALPWQLEGWEADGFTGDYWSQNGFNGNGTTGTPWSQNGFNGNGTVGSPWVNNGFNGNGFAGSPFLNNGFNGNGTQGSGWAQNGFTANSSTGETTNGDSWNLHDFVQSDGYKAGKYVVNDVIMGQVDLVGDAFTHQNMQNLGYNSSFGLSSLNSFRGGLLVNGLKLGMGDNFVFDAYDTANTVAAGVGGIQDFRTVRNLAQTADSVSDLAAASNITPPPAAVGALSKLNVAAAAVGTGFSVVETAGSISDFNDLRASGASGSELTEAGAKIGEGVGSTLMNAGVVTTAIPGGQLVGAGMVAAGAAVWVGSKLTGAIAKRWKGSVKETAKSMWNGAKEKVSGAFNTVKGWFS
ncbi:hypothetical protein SAMN05216362_10511 [Piscibacillus halophilus]|uniref:Uncharacterized protein n=1 Tax=Piscibacillus halophilus TaxID=571933 RepID=A0A1H9CAJ6_9BACI|nr:hypothetical protein SAMN05216362_10511 [Piscibacillus halophilus]